MATGVPGSCGKTGSDVDTVLDTDRFVRIRGGGRRKVGDDEELWIYGNGRAWAVNEERGCTYGGSIIPLTGTLGHSWPPGTCTATGLRNIEDTTSMMADEIRLTPDLREFLIFSLSQRAEQANGGQN